MYIGIEISNRCNAKCPWCFTNRVSDSNKFEQAEGIMTIDKFISIIERLEMMGLLHKDVVINLYAIGEPFLNKDLSKIFKYLDDKPLKYAISTNASVVMSFEEETKILKNLVNLIISIPGFSQESYNRVHGFRFDRMKNNIVKCVNNFRNSGFVGDVRLVYHVYQFNIDEIYKAKAFAEENQIDFYPYYAILYEWRHVRDYLNNTLQYDLLKKASQELFLGNIEKTISMRMSDFVCEFFNMLLIDLDGGLKTCCQIRKGDIGYSYGNIFNISAEEVFKRRTTQHICKECQDRGMDYYLSVYTLFNLSVCNTGQSADSQTHNSLENFLQKNIGNEIVLFGAGKFGIRVFEYLTNKNVKVDFFCDNNILKIGKRISGIQVITPQDMLKQCTSPRVIITTVNHRQVMSQLSQLGARAVYFPIDAYSY